MTFHRDDKTGLMLPERRRVIPICTGMAGRYMMTKAKANRFGQPMETTRKVVAPWFSNLITDLGLNKYGDSNNWLQYCHVGTGSTAPAVGDTNLASFLAGSLNDLNNDEGAQGSAPYYCWKFMGYRFAAGEATGNIAEVGVGSTLATGNLFSRALVLDGGGSPTTITVQSDEILDVFYEMRFYPPLSDTTGTVDLDGETFDYTGRASNVNSGSSSNGWNIQTYGVSAGYPSGTCIAYDGNIGAITGLPSGNTGTTSDFDPIGSYSNDSFEREFSAQYSISKANLAGGVRSISMKMGAGNWQIEFSRQSDSAAIPKDNTKVLTLNFKHTWARQ